MFNEKLRLNKNIVFSNRIVVSPMCQYKAINGCPTEWHYHHLRNLIETGAGSLIVESTAISKTGRITNYDLCLYSKSHYLAHKKLIKYLKKVKDIPIFLQISHSGRKGSAEIPWIKKNKSLSSKYKWQTISPSAISRTKSWPIPKEMSLRDIKIVVNQFRRSAKYAFNAGYDGVEIHMAHGYLVHQFCSPISNVRKDEYGLQNKSYKFPLEIIKAIKKNIKKYKIVGARITGTDHLKKGIKIKDCEVLVKKLKKEGLDYVCVSSGGIIPITNLKYSKGFRFKMAREIKRRCNIITRTSGLINDYETIKKGLVDYKLDLVSIGRKLVQDKFFLVKENKLNIKNLINQYRQCLNN
jgi:2,4-dienoyl-CoA reductase-like NADH-dependent reductase (Old Yellow Enzyme family)